MFKEEEEEEDRVAVDVKTHSTAMSLPGTEAVVERKFENRSDQAGDI